MQRDSFCHQCSYWGRMSPDEPLKDRDTAGDCYLTMNVIETKSMFTCVLWRSREQYGALPGAADEIAA